MEGTKKKILVVEDELPILQAIVDKFSRENFEVLQAKNGVEGVDIALKEKPDVVLLDIVMPEMDGLEALKKIRADEWGKEVPIFLLTNLSDMEKISEAVQIGIAGYLVKSDWKLEDVVVKVKEKLGM
jgi:DNA-binding response OmpR family regulator